MPNFIRFENIEHYPAMLVAALWMANTLGYSTTFGAMEGDASIERMAKQIKRDNLVPLFDPDDRYVACPDRPSMTKEYRMISFQEWSAMMPREFRQALTSTTALFKVAGEALRLDLKTGIVNLCGDEYPLDMLLRLQRRLTDLGADHIYFTCGSPVYLSAIGTTLETMAARYKKYERPAGEDTSLLPDEA
jgi:hypothetical protein